MRVLPTIRVFFLSLATIACCANAAVVGSRISSSASHEPPALSRANRVSVAGGASAGAEPALLSRTRARGGGVSMEKLALQPVTVGECSGPDCRELEWVFRVRKPPPPTEADAVEVQASSGLGPAAAPPPAPPTTDDPLGAALAQAFYAWLALPPKNFWVNLNPAEPERIIHPDLGSTAVGQALLNADFFMKNDTAFSLHPDSASGEAFWARVWEPPPAEVCVAFRQWIIPGEVQVADVGDWVYILSASLVVEEEMEFLHAHDKGRAEVAGAGGGCGPNVDAQLQLKADANYKHFLLPEINRRVNQDPLYATLRTVYYWRIVAQWFAEREPARYAGLMPSAWRTHSVEDGRRLSQQVYDRYAASIANGAYTAEDYVRYHPTGQVFHRVHTNGLIDFRHVHLRHM